MPLRCRAPVAAAMAVSSLLGATRAGAADLTCAAFQARLAAQLARLSLPATTLAIAPGRLTETTPHTTHDITADEGLTGNLECYGPDWLREVDLRADLKGLAPERAGERARRLQQLAAALAAALGGNGGRSATADLFIRVRARLAAAAREGDPLPAANEDAHLQGYALDLSASEGLEQFAITSDRPLPAH